MNKILCNFILLHFVLCLKERKVITMNSLTSIKQINELKAEFLSKSENESFARMIVAAFIAPLDPTIEELSDIRTAVSEAVTNAIVHAYPDTLGTVHISCSIDENNISITVKDTGCGIENIDMARTPLYTGSKDGERSGLGFTVMETFMDSIEVLSMPKRGTIVTMYKKIGVAKEMPLCV